MLTAAFQIANELDALLGSRFAESTGVEPVSPEGHEFSKLAHYRPAHSPVIILFYQINQYLLTYFSGIVSINHVINR